MNLEPLTIRDAQSGATAKILTGFGFNCYSFCPVVDGEPLEALWSNPDFTSGAERPSHSGIPILFPFAGRLRGSHLKWQGRSYPLGSDDGLGNAIHGFVLNRPWRVVEHQANRAVGEFQASIDEPGLVRRWPADFRLTASYEVRDQTLACEIQVFHPGEGQLPFGLGTHPYFRVPLGERGAADQCLITVPTGEYWELVNMLPSGRLLPADGPRHLAGGLRFGEARLDDVFTRLSFADGLCRGTIADPGSERKLELSFGPEFNHCVVYNPPHREAICLEPYTTAPDAFAMEQQGVKSDLLILNPGETFTARFEISVRRDPA